MKIDIPILATFFAIFSSCLLSEVKAACVEGSNEVTLYAGQTIDIGTISAEVSGDSLIVTYTTEGNWYLEETHLWLGDDLDDMPQTKKGNPKIGQFPYKEDFVSADGNVQSSSFSIPLVDTAIAFSCPGDDASYFIAAHAAVYRIDDDGDIVQTETAWGDGDRFVEKGMWGTYFEITLTCDCDDPPPSDDTACETAFAKSTAGGDECFLDFDIDEDGTPDFNRWGWTNGPLAPALAPDNTEIMEIYAAAGQCDTTKGTLVGCLTVTYSLDGTLEVTYTMIGGFFMEEIHLYVGLESLPKDKKKKDKKKKGGRGGGGGSALYRRALFMGRA